MAFTDSMELGKWKNLENQHSFSMTFDDYAGMLFKKDSKGNTSPAAGFVINPFGANIIVPKEMVAQYLAETRAKAQGQQPPVNPPN